MANDHEDESSLLNKGEYGHHVRFEFDKNVDTVVTEHKQILSEVNGLFNRVLYIVFVCAVTYCMRGSIFILYARHFYDNTSTISIFIYLSYISSGIVSLSVGFIGNKWRFDILLIIGTILDVITFGMEATAVNFYMLVVAYAVGAQPFQTLMQSWILNMYPTYYAKIYRTKIIQYLIIGGLLGTIIGGVIADYFSLQSVFYVSWIMSMVLLVVSFSIYNKEKTIQKKQLTMIDYYNMANNSKTHLNDYENIENEGNKDNIDNNDKSIDNIPNNIIALSAIMKNENVNDDLKWIYSDKFRFPICLLSMQPEPDGTMNHGDDRGDDNNVYSKYSLMDELSKLSNDNIFILCSLTFVTIVLIAFETIMQIYFITYMHDTFDLNIFVSSCMLATYLISLSVSMHFIKKLISNTSNMNYNSNINNNNHGNVNTAIEESNQRQSYSFGNIFVTIILLCLISMIVFSSFVFPYISTFKHNIDPTTLCAIYWPSIILYSICFGASYASLNIILVDVMPRSIASIIAGIQGFARMMSKSIFVLIVGLLWDYTPNYLWYMHACQQSISLIIMLIIAIMESYCKKAPHQIQ